MIDETPKSVQKEYAKEFLTFTGDHSELQQFAQLLNQLPPALSRWGLQVLSLVMILWLQGCMYTPDYGEIFDHAPNPLSRAEINSREQRIRGLLTDPTPMTRTPVLQSGIEQFQLNRVLENFEELINLVSEEDFNEYLEICLAAKTNQGIMNPDRYDPDLLQASQEYYSNPDILPDRQVILAVIARKDRQSIGGVQALNAETYRLREFMQAYKVIIIETDEISEILQHISILGRSGVLRVGNLKGIFFVGHGNESSIDVGLAANDLMKISRFNWYLSKDEPSFVVFASCNSSDGGLGSFASQGSLLFPKTKIIACDGYAGGINFTLDENGRLPDDLNISFSGAVIPTDSTFVPEHDELSASATLAYANKMQDPNIPDHYVNFAIRAGLIRIEDIVQAFYTGTDPNEYRIFLDCGFSYSEIANFRQQNIHVSNVFGYAQLGISSPALIIQLVSNGVIPERFIEYLREGISDVRQMIQREAMRKYQARRS